MLALPPEPPSFLLHTPDDLTLRLREQDVHPESVDRCQGIFGTGLGHYTFHWSSCLHRDRELKKNVYCCVPS